MLLVARGGGYSKKKRSMATYRHKVVRGITAHLNYVANNGLFL